MKFSNVMPTELPLSHVRKGPMSADWRARLTVRYPHLYRRTVDGRDGATGYPSVGEGWRDLIEIMSSRVDAALSKCGSPEMTITRIKQKFGGLRVYTENRRLPEEIFVKVCDAIDLAEARADCTCETCGAAGVLHEYAGWLNTRCEEHGVGRTLLPTAGWENLVVKYSAESGSTRIMSCRRYDRERDAFEDASVPPDLETEEEDRQ